MIIAPFCLYFRLIHFIFSSKTQKIVSNKRAKSLLETETAFINNGNNKCKNNRPLFSDEETINIMGSSIGNINIQFYYFIHTIG
jgi:hypothetical protein